MFHTTIVLRIPHKLGIFPKLKYNPIELLLKFVFVADETDMMQPDVCGHNLVLFGLKINSNCQLKQEIVSWAYHIQNLCQLNFKLH